MGFKANGIVDIPDPIMAVPQADEGNVVDKGISDLDCPCKLKSVNEQSQHNVMHPNRF